MHSKILYLIEKDGGNENNSIDALKEYKIRKDIEEALLRAAFERLNLTSSNIWYEIKKKFTNIFIQMLHRLNPVNVPIKSKVTYWVIKEPKYLQMTNSVEYLHQN